MPRACPDCRARPAGGFCDACLPLHVPAEAAQEEIARRKLDRMCSANAPKVTYDGAGVIDAVRSMATQELERLQACARAAGVDQPQYHYVIVRGDLTPGEQMAQAIHAAGETAALACSHRSPGMPLRADCRAVALRAKDEAELGNVVRVLRVHAAQHIIIRETEGPHAGHIMAIGVFPGSKLECLRWLPLVR